MSSDNVVPFTGLSYVDLPPEYLLDKAKEWDMKHCLIVGHTEEGALRFGGTTSSTADILLLLERARINLLNEITETDNEQG